MPVTADQKTPPTISIGRRNPAYHIEEFDNYDFIGASNYEHAVVSEPLVENAVDSPEVSIPYERLGPEYLRIIG